MLRGVVFDLDGTLVDCFSLHYKAASEVFSEMFDLEFPRQHLKKHYGLSTKEIARKFFEKSGAVISNEKLDEYVSRRRERIIELIQTDGVLLLAGALKLLTELSKKKLKLGIATSNTVEATSAILGSSEIDCFFDTVVSRGDVSAGKPEPDFFLIAANELKLNPSDCVAVEDSVYGVLAAQKAEMKVVGVTSGFHAYEQLKPYSNLVVQGLKDLDYDTLSGLFTSSTKALDLFVP